MDTITHTLLGLTSYGAVNKNDMEKSTKHALLFSCLIGSQIPDVDIVANLTETGRIMEQMWHRGLTHSLFLTPVWAILIYFIAVLIWKRKDTIIFFMAWLSVIIHVGSDALNTWGTGLFEPFSSLRISFGFISIVDFVIWAVILVGYLVKRVAKGVEPYKVWRAVGILILLHVGIQSAQAVVIFQEAKKTDNHIALAARFIPWHFTVIAKTDNVVTIYEKNVWSEKVVQETLYSKDDANLERLFSENPKAKVLMQWSPFVVVIEEEHTLAIYDPRFYRNGSSFLMEAIQLQ